MSAWWLGGEQRPGNEPMPSPLEQGGQWRRFSGPSVGDFGNLPWAWWSPDALTMEQAHRAEMKRKRDELAALRDAQLQHWQAFTSTSIEGNLSVGSGDSDDLISIDRGSLGWALAEACGIDDLVADLGRVRITIERID